MGLESTEILKGVSRYYESRLEEFGSVPRGVDWKDSASQLLRFHQLMKISEGESKYSLNDIGCGYGALVDFLSSSDTSFSYTGFDISSSMIGAASKLYEGRSDVRFASNFSELSHADYSVASGIFNVKLNFGEDEWMSYILKTIESLSSLSQKGFSFNLLSTYSDLEKRRGDLFYGDPCYFFDYCKRKFSRNVSLLHDYGLYEFTILVRM